MVSVNTDTLIPGFFTINTHTIFPTSIVSASVNLRTRLSIAFKSISAGTIKASYSVCTVCVWTAIMRVQIAFIDILKLNFFVQAIQGYSFLPAIVAFVSSNISSVDSANCWNCSSCVAAVFIFRE